jgi:hypothetical protein
LLLWLFPDEKAPTDNSLLRNPWISGPEISSPSLPDGLWWCDCHKTRGAVHEDSKLYAHINADLATRGHLMHPHSMPLDGPQPGQPQG